MPPKRSGGTTRGRPKASKTKASVTKDPESDNPFELSSDEQPRGASDDDVSRDQTKAHGEEEPEKSIPRDLLTRLLHEFFAKDSTRISRDANAAVGKYVDIFLREAIARAALEKKGGFLEVEDLERIAPQLLLDL